MPRDPARRRDRVLSDTRTSAGVDYTSLYREMYVGKISREVVASHRDALSASGADGTATFILGGQIQGETPETFSCTGVQLHPVIEDATVPADRRDQVRKFWLELAVQPGVDLDLAIKIALGSMLSTTRANLSVGPPFDLAVYRNEALAFDELAPIPWNE